jgi:hypothetical protein
MNAIVKKAFAKISELPKPLQKSVARKLLDNVGKWQALQRDVTAGFASGPSSPWIAEDIKRTGRKRLAGRRKKTSPHAGG